MSSNDPGTEPNIQKQMETLVEQMFVAAKAYFDRKRVLMEKPNSCREIADALVALKAAVDPIRNQLKPLAQQYPQLWDEYRAQAPSRIRETLPSLFKPTT
ncbi:MAG: hypothetical protein WCD70_05665 [Alphaproteobacteria bacterium]